MQVKLLENLIEEIAGEGTGSIAQILFNKKDVNEFLIAKKMDLTINQVRNILYKLSNHRLVSFIRKKDNKKGWYIYYWTLDSEKCLVMIEDSLTRKINQLEEMLQSRSNDRYYVCKPCGIEVREEVALEHGFTCEECAEVYELSDNAPHIRDVKAKITRVTKELDLIKSELEEVREKKLKKRKRAAKKEQKEADEKKELLKKARALAKKKVAKETSKKTTKKTVKKTTKAAAKKKVAKKATTKKVTKKPAAKKTVKKALKSVAKKVKKAVTKSSKKKTVKKK